MWVNQLTPKLQTYGWFEDAQGSKNEFFVVFCCESTAGLKGNCVALELSPQCICEDLNYSRL